MEVVEEEEEEEEEEEKEEEKEGGRDQRWRGFTRITNTIKLNSHKMVSPQTPQIAVGKGFSPHACCMLHTTCVCL